MIYDYETYQRSDSGGKAMIMRALFERISTLEREVKELKQGKPADAIGKLMPLTAYGPVGFDGRIRMVRTLRNLEEIARKRK